MKSLAAAAVIALMVLPAFANSSLLIEEFRVNQDPDVYCVPQSEPSIAIDPQDPNRIMVAAHHPSPFGLQGLGAYFSGDGGLTWEQAVIPGEDFDPLEPELNAVLDPSVGIDSRGNFYIGVLASYISARPRSVATALGEKNGVYVVRIPRKRAGDPMFRSPLDPSKRLTIVAVSRTAGARLKDDKPLLAVDSNPSSFYRDRVYVVWTRFEEGPARGQFRNKLLLGYSGDGGRTFLEPIVIDANAMKYWPHAAFLLVGPTGEVYVFWFVFLADIDDDDPQSQSAPFPGALYMAKSSNGGRTFSRPKLIHNVVSPPRRLGPTGIKVNAYPSAAISAQDGRTLALAWTDYASGDADVFLSVSRDGGGSWTEPVRMNDDPYRNGRDQFFPTASIDDTGRIWVAWFDRRLHENAYYDLFASYASIGTDNAVLLAPSFRVTSTPSQLGDFCHQSGNRFIGDYIDSAAIGGTFIPVWADGRRGQLDIFIAKITRGKSSSP